MSNTSIAERAKKVLLQNYKQQPIALVRGQGCRVWDADGKEYLDMIGGIATCALGHCHPVAVEAAQKQLDRLWHVSNVYYTEPQIELAEKLTAASQLKDARAFFCNSGAEANEAMLKLARRAQGSLGHPERFEVISFQHSFHGRTLATLAATGQEKYQAGFAPLPAGFRYAVFGDLDSVERALTPNTGAVLVEPIQGEGGVRLAPEGFLRALREFCDRRELLLLIDEVQTGMGRTGAPFAYLHEGPLADAFSLAKSLGNGLPVGAMVVSGEFADALPAGTHGSTFGGNPVTCAVASAVFDLTCSPRTMAENVRKGGLALQHLQTLAKKRPDRIQAVRGRGLLYGVELNAPVASVLQAAREKGMLVNAAGDFTVRFAPAYGISDAELLKATEILEACL